MSFVSNRAASHLPSNVRYHERTRKIILCFFALLFFLIGAIGSAYAHLQSNITQTDISALLGENRPSEKPADPNDPNAGKALNVLVLGSDTREGDSDLNGEGERGEVGGMRADTTMLFHISADRSRIQVVSIPRDTLVNIPQCTVLPKDGNMENSYPVGPERMAMFNAAFQYGGMEDNVASAAACSIKTLEQITNIRIDNFVVVDFASFIHIVNALDGVPMYFEESLYDQLSGLDIQQGCRLVDGGQALALARARYQIGDGSDLSRITRQQALVKAIVHEVLSVDMLTDIPKLYQVLGAATSSLTTSQGFGDLQNLAGLAVSLKGINLDNIQFITLPWQPYVYDTNRVVVSPLADDLFSAIALDHEIEVTKDANGNTIAIKDITANPPTAQPEDGTSANTPAHEGTVNAAEATNTDGLPAQETENGDAQASLPSFINPVCTRSNAVK